MPVIRVTCEGCGYQRDMEEQIQKAKWRMTNLRKESDKLWRGTDKCGQCISNEIRDKIAEQKNGHST